MHNPVKNYKEIINVIEQKLKDQNKNNFPKIIAVSKTFKLDKILPLIEYGHLDYGENKVQEALEKWSEIKTSKQDINLHLIGKLQTNKVKFAINIFDYIHSLDSEKLAKKIAQEEIRQNKKIKLFIQVNIGDESQKSGIPKSQVNDLFNYCKKLNLNVIGLMCIPPIGVNPEKYFSQIKLINEKLNLKELSMGMSTDYLTAIDYSSTFLRIGSNIFGKRD